MLAGFQALVRDIPCVVRSRVGTPSVRQKEIGKAEVDAFASTPSIFGGAAFDTL